MQLLIAIKISALPLLKRMQYLYTEHWLKLKIYLCNHLKMNALFVYFALIAFNNIYFTIIKMNTVHVFVYWTLKTIKKYLCNHY